jgi:hypothetical protein
MTQAKPLLEVPACQPESTEAGRPRDRFDEPGRHRVIADLPPWLPLPRKPPPPPLAPLAWRARVVEFAGLAVATVCYAAAICAAARALYLAEESRLGLGMFAALAALCAGFTWLGCRVVQALGRWLQRARALTSARPAARCACDPSPHPPPRDSTC